MMASTGRRDERSWSRIRASRLAAAPVKSMDGGAIGKGGDRVVGNVTMARFRASIKMFPASISWQMRMLRREHSVMVEICPLDA